VAAPRRSARDDPWARTRRTWRRACTEAIAAAESDGAEVPALLERLSRTFVASWPRASTLVLAALELDPTDAGRVDLARAWIAEGRSHAGVRILRDLLARDPGPEDRRQALEALALALECLGDSARSLECYAAALDSPRSGPRVAVSMFALALRCGDSDRSEIAARRLRPLDLSVSGSRARFESALARALERAGRGSPALHALASDPRADHIRRIANEGVGAEAAVARALLSPR